MGPRSPLRSGRRRADIPRMSCAPSSARLRLLWGRCPWFKVSPPARSLQNRRPPPDVLQPVFRKASVVAWQAPMGPRSLLRYGRCRTDVPPDVLQPVFRKASVIAWQAPHGSKVSPLQPIFRVKMG